MSEATLTAIATIAATLISVIGTGLWLGRGQRELGRRLDDMGRDNARAHEAIGENIHRRTRRRRIRRIIRDPDHW